MYVNDEDLVVKDKAKFDLWVKTRWPAVWIDGTSVLRTKSGHYLYPKFIVDMYKEMEGEA